MCNIAGYIGTKRAAPILLEMMKRQEGLAGGYYTGIATLHEGKIYYAKLTGDLERLIRETNAADLPGTVGIIHSRSKSGGGDEWAHPFLGGAQIAYVANGTAGIFKERREEFNKIAECLLQSGFTMTSRVQTDNEKYQRLSDGTAVHMSDVMCQLILQHGGDMEKAFCEMPGEIVGLMVDAAHPARIQYARINYPMSVGFAEHGAYLASAALAFPEDAGAPQLLPACSSGWISRDERKTVAFQKNPAKVAALDSATLEKGYKVILAALQTGKKSCKELCQLVRPLFEEADCAPVYALVYDAMYRLQDRLIIETEWVPGAFNGLKAPHFLMGIRTE